MSEAAQWIERAAYLMVVSERSQTDATRAQRRRGMTRDPVLTQMEAYCVSAERAVAEIRQALGAERDVEAVMVGRAFWLFTAQWVEGLVEAKSELERMRL